MFWIQSHWNLGCHGNTLIIDKGTDNQNFWLGLGWYAQWQDLRPRKYRQWMWFLFSAPLVVVQEAEKKEITLAFKLSRVTWNLKNRLRLWHVTRSVAGLSLDISYYHWLLYLEKRARCLELKSAPFGKIKWGAVRVSIMAFIIFSYLGNYCSWRQW